MSAVKALWDTGRAPKITLYPMHFKSIDARIARTIRMLEESMILDEDGELVATSNYDDAVNAALGELGDLRELMRELSVPVPAKPTRRK